MSKAIELEENINDAICRVLADSEESEDKFAVSHFFDEIAVHTLHLLWLIDSDKWPELKKYFDSMPRGLYQHVSEIQDICAQAGSKVAQTGKIE